MSNSPIATSVVNRRYPLLRAETVVGSLKPGKSADLAVVALPERDEADPYQLLLDSELLVVGTAFEGRFVAGRWSDL